MNSQGTIWISREVTTATTFFQFPRVKVSYYPTEDARCIRTVVPTSQEKNGTS